jgi:hypothetical protein
MEGMGRWLDRWDERNQAWADGQLADPPPTKPRLPVLPSVVFVFFAAVAVGWLVQGYWLRAVPPAVLALLQGWVLWHWMLARRDWRASA